MVLSADIVSEHVAEEPLEVQSPPQPAICHPAAGDAVRVTDVPFAYEAVTDDADTSDTPATSDDVEPLPVWVTARDLSTTKVAVTERAWSMVTAHDPDPEHAPPHALSTQPEAGVAVRVTTVWSSNDELVDDPDVSEMPDGLDETVPVPVRLTLSVQIFTNVAVTPRSLFMVTEQVPVPEQSPDQPEKRQPDAAVAVNETDVPVSNVAVVDVPEESEIPEGLDETLPEPVRLTVRSQIFTNVAVTPRSLFIVAEQVPVPEQSPDQPEKRQPDAAVAVRVTAVPESYRADVEPAAARLTPAGDDDTDPLPTWVAERVHTSTNSAVTDRDWLIVTTQVPVPEHPSPDQPRNSPAPLGVAVRVTTVLSVKRLPHVPDPSAHRLMPDGLDDTEPPAPLTTTSRFLLPGGINSNVTVTDFAEVIETVQSFMVPEHPPPDHEAMRQPEAAAAEMTTDASLSYAALEVSPSVDVEITEPGVETDPFPAWVTVIT